MNDTDSPASARVSVARALLEGSFKAVETNEIIGRLKALEALIDLEVPR